MGIPADITSGSCFAGVIIIQNPLLHKWYSVCGLSKDFKTGVCKQLGFNGGIEEFSEAKIFDNPTGSVTIPQGLEEYTVSRVAPKAIFFNLYCNLMIKSDIAIY